MAEHPEGGPQEISATTVTNVRTLVADFILPHSIEFYRSTEELTNGERLRKVASWILTCQQSVVTARELIRNVSTLRGVSVFDLNSHVSPLVAAGWLDPMELGPLNRSWKVNPIVASQFEERRKTEEKRKILVAKLMGATRKHTGG
jgi:hypothetical protein